jgi:Zn-finger nucleic acid-binding protein
MWEKQMEFNPEVHSIKCPKCGQGMDQISYGGDLVIDRCTGCHGMWFDHGEVDQLKKKWMGDALDIGEVSEGKDWDTVDNIACPRCGKDMAKA